MLTRKEQLYSKMALEDTTPASDSESASRRGDISTLTTPAAADLNQLFDNESLTEKRLFSPLLSVQRYQKVCELVSEFGVKSILDVGCGECRLIQKLKNIEHLERITGVDIDNMPLTMSKIQCRPLACDYLCPRDRPLILELYCGDINNLDSRILDHDMVSLVEVVEHLHEDDLAKMPDIIFGAINPKYCVMTTPNAEYNVLFDNFSGMRHWDHKFEWTRAEFQAWASDVGLKYGFKVDFDGVGAPPDDKNVGFCTQIAIFERLNDQSPPSKPVTMYENYTLICAEKYPYRTEEQKLRERICQEVERVLSELIQDNELNEITLDLLYEESILMEFCDREALASILISLSYNLSEDRKILLIDKRERGEYSFSSEDSGGQFSDAEDDGTLTIVFDKSKKIDLEFWD